MSEDRIKQMADLLCKADGVDPDATSAIWGSNRGYLTNREVQMTRAKNLHNAGLTIISVNPDLAAILDLARCMCAVEFEQEKLGELTDERWQQMVDAWYAADHPEWTATRVDRLLQLSRAVYMEMRGAMGTNYYHVTESVPGCEHCGRGPETNQEHIGKQSAGWSFGFCGLKHTSWEQWKAALQEKGEIRDEYGRLIPLEVFVQLIEDTKGRKNHSETYPNSNTWCDAEGHSFTKGEFG